MEEPEESGLKSTDSKYNKIPYYIDKYHIAILTDQPIQNVKRKFVKLHAKDRIDKGEGKAKNPNAIIYNDHDANMVSQQLSKPNLIKYFGKELSEKVLNELNQHGITWNMFEISKEEEYLRSVNVLQERGCQEFFKGRQLYLKSMKVAIDVKDRQGKTLDLEVMRSEITRQYKTIRDFLVTLEDAAPLFVGQTTDQIRKIIHKKTDTMIKTLKKKSPARLRTDDKNRQG